MFEFGSFFCQAHYWIVWLDQFLVFNLVSVWLSCPLCCDWSLRRLVALPIYYICKRRRKRSQGSGRWLCWFSLGHPSQVLDTQTHTLKIALGANWPNTGHLDTTITTNSFPVRCISWISSIAQWPFPPHGVFGIVIKDNLRRFCFWNFFIYL